MLLFSCSCMCMYYAKMTPCPGVLAVEYVGIALNNNNNIVIVTYAGYTSTECTITTGHNAKTGFSTKQ